MKATIHGFRVAAIALGCYWGLLFLGTHVPANRLLSQIGHNDKLIHAAAFAGLSFLMAWALPTNPNRPMQNVLWAAAIGFAYAPLDELLQIPVGRTADWRDVLADWIGVFLGLTVYTLSRAYVTRSQWQLFRES